MRLNGLFVAISMSAVAQRVVAQSPTIPIHPLGRFQATTPESLITVTDVRILSDGNALVRDQVGRRVLFLDANLKRIRSVIDTMSDATRGYGQSGGRLLAYYGDTSLYVDNASLAFVVIAPDGHIVRTMAAPTYRGNVNYMTGLASRVMFDGSTGIISGPFLSQGHTSVEFDEPIAFRSFPDSAPIVRIDMRTSRWDTLTYIAAPVHGLGVRPSSGDTGRVSLNSVLPVSDAWAVLDNGTLAVVRGVDYHIDWVDRHGVVVSSPVIQHDWWKISDSLKRFLVDSSVKGDSIRYVTMMARQDSMRQANSGRPGSGVPSGRAGGPGGGGTSAGGNAGSSISAQSGVPAKAADRIVPASIRGGATGAGRVVWNGNVIDSPRGSEGHAYYVDVDGLPDYFPPFAPNARVLSDGVGTLWIPAAFRNPPDGGQVYDIVNQKGVLVDRVQVPGGTSVVAVTPDYAYITARVGTITQLVKARIR